MKADQDLLNEAKERVAKGHSYTNWDHLTTRNSTLNKYYHIYNYFKEAVELASIETQKQITDLKAELSALREEKEKLIEFVKHLKYMDGSKAQHEFTPKEILESFLKSLK